MPIRTILGSLAEGAKIGEILADFPTVSEQAIWAIIAFAAASAKEDLPKAIKINGIVDATGRKKSHG